MEERKKERKKERKFHHELDLKPLVLQKYLKRIAAGELQFSFACDGEDALRVLEEEPEIELIATDINMPVMDGLTLLGQVRKLTRLTKTIIVSAYDDLENIRTAMNRGAYDFVTKPIDFADLERTIDKTPLELDELRSGAARRVSVCRSPIMNCNYSADSAVDSARNH